VSDKNLNLKHKIEFRIVWQSLVVRHSSRALNGIQKLHANLMLLRSGAGDEY